MLASLTYVCILDRCDFIGIVVHKRDTYVCVCVDVRLPYLTKLTDALNIKWLMER